MPNGVAGQPRQHPNLRQHLHGQPDARVGPRDRDRGRFSVRNPDNISVDDDGKLWIASLLNEPVEGRCPDNHAGPCLLPFEIIKAHPDAMTAEVVLRHEGEPMGYVAVPRDGRLWLGTASGDRFASVELL